MRARLSFPRLALMIAALAGPALLMAGCTAAALLENAKYRFVRDKDVNMLDLNYAAADYLVGQARGSLTSTSLILTKPLKESQNELATSKFARLIPEQVAARMVQLGYKVKATPRDDGTNKPETRRHFLLTGTYLVGASTVTVNLRLLDSETEQIMAAYDYVMPIDEDIDTLVKPEPTAMRVPG